MSNRTLKESTLEGLIEDLDKRGLLVLQILLGQQAMKLLTLEKIKENTSTLIAPDTSNLRTSSISTTG